MSEGVIKRLTLPRDIVADGKPDKISVEEIPLGKTNDNIPIKVVMEKWRLAIKRDKEGE